jgi:hypothetical protein
VQQFIDIVIARQGWLDDDDDRRARAGRTGW